MDTQQLDAQARGILSGNDRGGYTVPTDGLYPYQWNWDSAFAAWGFAKFDLNRAWTELETLMAGQWVNGMVPHILFHKVDPGYFPGPDTWGAIGCGPVPSSGISQPPVAASFAWRIYCDAPGDGRDRMAALFPKLLAWHRWFMDWRSQDGMIFVTHPWETGRDNAPDWDGAMAAIDPVGVPPYQRRDTGHVDPAMRPTKEDYDRYLWLVARGAKCNWDEAQMAPDRPFKVADPTMTFILLRANQDLAKMADMLGEERAEIDGWIADLQAGTERLRHPDTGVYTAVDLNTGTHTGHVSNASFLSWYAGIDSDVMLAELKESFANSTFPVPSHKAGTSEFEPKRYWRGPTWAMLNALIAIGLFEKGHHDLAEDLRQRTAQLIGRHGFAEYFHPETGAPEGGGTFTWTAAVWLAWASPSATELKKEH